MRDDWVDKNGKLRRSADCFRILTKIGSIEVWEKRIINVLGALIVFLRSLSEIFDGLFNFEIFQCFITANEFDELVVFMIREGYLFCFRDSRFISMLV